MSTVAHGWTLRRHVPPGVTNLEVWNLPVLGHELWELLGSARVDEARRDGVPESMLAFHLLPALAGALGELTSRHDVDAVWLSGGLACLEGFAPLVEEVTAALPCPVYVADDPRFAPVRAGLRILAPMRPNRPVALDMGQTSIKCASPQAVHVFERDTATLPLLFIGMPRPADKHHIPAAVRFVAGALRDFAGQQPPDALCLALPCPLDAALLPGGCTYGWEGHAPLVADILRESALPTGGTVLVLNDAELAAEAARGDARLADSRRVLCLTLGFGPGGALLERA
ncbi:ROK family protein [Pyxidicoccus fallax]|uniref:ROK family protein n=1 Tax=Pyxidicoccus fallax TaxID=394095 RepID=A0A848LB13_9BACT|nr:ROK family protein [Pyxidicoccus fallax]NMO16099.1 ROK family protein [Pyxidicoccus fallax]NPC83257.1 ROK family protein [Pyxidicoccus fallax]